MALHSLLHLDATYGPIWHNFRGLFGLVQDQQFLIVCTRILGGMYEATSRHHMRIIAASHSSGGGNRQALGMMTVPLIGSGVSIVSSEM